VISFIEKENRIRFEINAQAADSAGLALSSKLLNLALIVGDENESAELRRRK
jgi:hypothetical protein